MAVDKKVVDEQISKLGEFDRFGTKKEIAYLPEVLSPNETIYALTSGLYDNGTWLITVTDKRVIFLDKGMLYGLKQTEILLENISSVSHKTGMLMGEIIVTTSGESKKITHIEKSEVKKVSEIISNLQQNSKDTTHQTSESPKAVDDEVIVKLERLAVLKEKGILTEEELSVQKARILAL